MSERSHISVLTNDMEFLRKTRRFHWEELKKGSSVE